MDRQESARKKPARKPLPKHLWGGIINWLGPVCRSISGAFRGKSPRRRLEAAVLGGVECWGLKSRLRASCEWVGRWRVAKKYPKVLDRARANAYDMISERKIMGKNQAETGLSVFGTSSSVPERILRLLQDQPDFYCAGGDSASRAPNGFGPSEFEQYVGV